VKRSISVASASLSGSPEKPGREQQDEQRRGDDPQQGDEEQRDAERAGDAVRQRPDLLVRALGLVLGQHRHESLRERPLREQAAQEVRNLEGDHEHVHARPRAEHAREHDVAREAQDARGEGVAADDSGGACETHSGSATCESGAS
jgi:hypothetical protein